ncbi:MAG: pyridoxine 5'-phosphate synthase [Pseudomonadota bacterium]
MTKLSVNMNVPALLRNRRDQPWPDVADLGRQALAAGAFGLTVHPRPDERHTRPSDVYALGALIAEAFAGRELNVEGYPDARFLEIVNAAAPHQVTLVPDAPDQATSDHGWDFVKDRALLAEWIEKLRAPGRRIAVFADAEAEQMAAAAEIGVDRVELYTGPYGAAHSSSDARERELSRLADAAQAARAAGLGVNAGHDLTVLGTQQLVQRIPEIDEVSIGHALFCDTLTYGLRETVKRYLAACAAKS